MANWYMSLNTFQSLGQPLRSNAFLIPRWGGIAIKNPPKAATGRLEFSREDLKPFMEIFVAQLRGLIGIHDLQKTMSSLVSFLLYGCDYICRQD
jgi:phosphatidylinositol glycan class S